MNFNAARQSFSFSAAVSVALAGLFAVRFALAPRPLEQPFTEGMPLAAGLAGFSAGYPRLSAAIATVIVLWTLFIIVRLTARYAPAASRNYLPFQFFIIAACGMIFPGELLASLLAAWLLALSTKHFVNSFRKDYRFEDAFRAGLFSGLIPLLYAPGTVFLLLIPVAMSLYRRSSRELAVCLAGAMLPIPAAGFLYWAFGSTPSFIYAEIWRCLSTRPGIEYPAQFPVTESVVAGLVAALAFAAVVWFMAHRKGMRTRQRKVMAHISLMLVLTLAMTAIPGGSPSSVPMIAVAVAMAVPYSFSGRRQALVSSIVYCLILISVLALNLAPILGVQIP